MYSPPVQLQPISTTHYFVSGDVIIHEGVAIAPGVLLQADPDSQIVIGVGVCLGIGCVVHAHRGAITIGEGAIIGAGVLLVGQVSVGARVCIGSATTVFDCEISANAMIAPGSLMGDRSRPPDVIQEVDPRSAAVPLPKPPPPPTPEVAPETAPEVAPEMATEVASPDLGVAESAEPAMPEAVESPGVNVYGQVYVNQLLVKLFPHKQPLGNVPEG